MSPAVARISNARNVEEIIWVDVNIRSETVITETKALSFTMRVQLLTYGGTIIFIACGRTTRRIRRTYPIPMAFAASICPFGTACTPARKISAMYAVDTSVIPTTADRNAGMRTPNVGPAK